MPTRRLHLHERVAVGFVVSGLLLGLATAHPRSLLSPALWALGGVLGAAVALLVGRWRQRRAAALFPPEWLARGEEVTSSSGRPRCRRRRLPPGLYVVQGSREHRRR